MSDLQSYLNIASEKVQRILRRQWREAVEDREIVCPCGQRRALELAFRCLYCGIYFCTNCAERHFGETRAQRLESRRR
jgi:ferredoxin-thioredoxin reductase catalytic subunit